MQEFKHRGKSLEMKFVKKILVAFALVAGLSVAAMAQKGGPQKPPPKDPPPAVVPSKGNPQPRETPKGGDKPKKPGISAAIRREDPGVELA